MTVVFPFTCITTWVQRDKGANYKVINLYTRYQSVIYGTQRYRVLCSSHFTASIQRYLPAIYNIYISRQWGT